MRSTAGVASRIAAAARPSSTDGPASRPPSPRSGSAKRRRSHGTARAPSASATSTDDSMSAKPSVVLWKAARSERNQATSSAKVTKPVTKTAGPAAASGVAGRRSAPGRACAAVPSPATRPPRSHAAPHTARLIDAATALVRASPSSGSSAKAKSSTPSAAPAVLSP